MGASNHGISYLVECFMKKDINMPKVRKILFCILRTQENWPSVRFRKLKRHFEMPTRRGYFDDKIH